MGEKSDKKEIEELEDKLWRYIQYPNEGRFSDKEIREIRSRYKRLQEKTIKKAVLFVRHIERHLERDKGEEVICKICEKTIDEIYAEEG